VSERAGIHRHPERDVHEEGPEILSAGLVAHVGFSVGPQPFVIPFAYYYDTAAPTTLYLHGSTQSRTLQDAASGMPLCIAVTLLDGLVYSRSAKFHSMNYRSVVCFGTGRLVDDARRKAAVFEAMVSRYFRNRRPGVIDLSYRAPNIELPE
jgi:nitroimidazol reductase NimA-like FMN-containing flavoprotein (pyridoxamine 5'-phosphate oxidase superfamily)